MEVEVVELLIVMELTLVVVVELVVLELRHKQLVLELP